MRIRDQGIGIASDQLQRIFDMFTQVDQSLERAQGGLGIGLTLVRRLVEMHNGSVHATSDGIGRGAEFVVQLPIARAITTAATYADPDNSSTNPGLRILVVDDNRDGAESLALMLRILGNETRIAYDGEDGVAQAESYQPDVILFDIGLPKMNGYEACRCIRKQPWGQRPVVIAVTGWGQPEDRMRSQQAGFDHHLVKPIDTRALMKLLTEFRLSAKV